MNKNFLLEYTYYYYNQGTNERDRTFKLVFAKSFGAARQKLLKECNNDRNHRINEDSIENNTIE